MINKTCKKCGSGEIRKNYNGQLYCYKCGCKELEDQEPKECEHEIEMVHSGGSDGNPLPCCKKCGCIIYQIEKYQKDLDNDQIIIANIAKQTREEVIEEVIKEVETSGWATEEQLVEIIKKLKK